MKVKNTIYNKFIKRFLDIVLALILLIFLSPIYLILILTLYIVQGRPIFFTQTRLGLNGKKFNMYKFRTMTLTRKNLELNSNIQNEITTIGRILRIMSLDELPQVFNILKGDMSFIGPRPWIPEIYDYLPNESKKRLNVLPGLTGSAQVNGRNGINMDKKVELDLLYINNISFAMDVYIFFRTFYCIFSYKYADISEQELVKEIKNLKNYKVNNEND